MAARETVRHLTLKRLAFRWAIEQRFRLAAMEVQVPQLRARLDVAACKLEAPRKVKGKAQLKAGVCAVFECKQDRADFLKDSGNEEVIRARLRTLHDRRLLYEESLRRNFPTLREGETLFPEYDAFRYREAGWEPYNLLMAEMEDLTLQLHSRTKFAKLLRWKAANLHYVVAEPGVAQAHEVPAGWGLLERQGNALELRIKAEWQEAPDMNRFNLLHRVALAATNALEARLDGGW